MIFLILQVFCLVANLAVIFSMSNGPLFYRIGRQCEMLCFLTNPLETGKYLQTHIPQNRTQLWNFMYEDFALRVFESDTFDNDPDNADSFAAFYHNFDVVNFSLMTFHTELVTHSAPENDDINIVYQ